MYEKTIYVANDGKEFEDWAECTDYENSLLLGDDGIKFFITEDGKPKQLIVGSNIKNEYDVETALNRAEFVVFSDSEKLSFFSNFADEEYGIKFFFHQSIDRYDDDKNITFVWDDDKEAFVDADNKDEELYNEWHSFNTILGKVKREMA